ncbi:hypothetical protein SABIM44S_01832 [Streptomyces abikoensis]
MADGARRVCGARSVGYNEVTPENIPYAKEIFNMTKKC